MIVVSMVLFWLSIFMVVFGIGDFVLDVIVFEMVDGSGVKIIFDEIVWLESIVILVEEEV